MKKDFLPNSPLKEALFELHWDLEYISEEKIHFDRGFEQAVFNFTNACQQEFKELLILKPDNIPPAAFINRVTHRFHKEKGEHPLYQIGPGVFTVNDDKKYVWKNFLGLIKSGVKCLKASYEKELTLSLVQLGYVDSVSPYIFGDQDKFEFLKKHLQVNAESYPFVKGKLENIQFKKSFSLDDDSNLNIIITTGVNLETKEDVIEWHTFISNNKRLTWHELLDWVEKAHDNCSEIFKTMISDELYKYFSK